MSTLVFVDANGITCIYEIGAGQTAASQAATVGVTDPDFYAEFESTDFDPACYNFPGAFTLTLGVVGFDLNTAKEIADGILKSRSTAAELAVLNGYSPLSLASQAALAEVNRLPVIQAAIASVNALAVSLQAKLTAIAAATTIGEVNNVVYPTTGILFTGRGSGRRPEDLNVSYYTEFDSSSTTEAETELYIPGTGIVVPYGSGGPGQFDTMGDCFNVGDYRLQVRESATNYVIAEIVVPLNPAGEDVAF